MNGDIADIISPEAEALLNGMVETHLGSAGSAYREFHTVLMGGGLGLQMIFPGESSTPWVQQAVDSTALNDLTGWGFLRRGRFAKGSTVLEVTAAGVQFHRQLRERRGLAIDAVAGTIQRRLAEGSGFASTHPGAAEHLREAFALVWTGHIDDGTVSEIGLHLRSAVIEVTSTVANTTGDPEKVGAALKAWVATRPIDDREAAALAELIKVAQTLNNRLTHIREHAAQGRPLKSWNEVRRAAFK